MDPVLAFGEVMYFDFKGDKLGLLLLASGGALPVLRSPMEGIRCKLGFFSKSEETSQLLLLVTTVRPVVD